MLKRYFYLVALTAILPLLSFAMDENPRAQFYHTPSGEMIMNPNTFNDGIKALLFEENRFVLKNVIEKYHCLFEIGCGSSERAFDVTRLGGYFYGIDINPRHIEDSNAFFKERNMLDKASANTVSINDITHDNFPCKEKKTLVYFPFNLLGNLDDFHLVLENMIEIGQDFCFSTYKINDTVKNVRADYYKNCGCQQLRYSTTPVGDLYSSKDGLHSAAFKIGYITELIDAVLENNHKNAVVTIIDLANMAYMVYVHDIKDR